MELELIKRSSVNHEGFGAGEGTVDTTEYKCPCGQGKVIYTRDNIPGFRTSDVWIECDTCHSNYKINDKGDLELKEKV
jgi:hypothetical protein